MKKFNKVVILDTVIFYREHIEVLKSLVENPVIERIPLEFNQLSKSWELPRDYTVNKDANIIFWPSSLPEAFEGITLETHQQLKTAYCNIEDRLREDIHAQNLLNRIADADCIITCWTSIPDNILNLITPKAILTWTHEYEHRLNVKLANAKGIFTGCVDDYGTDAVAELTYNMIIELIARNFLLPDKAKSESDFVINCLSIIFNHYRKLNINEKNTRKGKFSHHFHKIGRAQQHFTNIDESNISDIIPYNMIENKQIGFIGGSEKFHKVKRILKNGFNVILNEYDKSDYKNADFYKLCGESELIFYDGTELSKSMSNLIQTLKPHQSFNLSIYNSYNYNISSINIAIVGLGRIGNRIKSIANAFEWSVTTILKSDFENQQIKEKLSECDIVSLNVSPHINKELFTTHVLSFLKRNTLFINTSDANVVNQKELTKKALNNELLIAMDVYQGLPTTKCLELDTNANGKIKNLLKNHIFAYRAGWNTYESIKTKTYKLLGLMYVSINN